MDRDQAKSLIDEITKVRKDMDAIKAYQLTIAESLETIAVNTTPADSQEATT